MKKKRIVSIAAALVLLAGICTAIAATAGSSADPLVSLSYIKNTFATYILGQASDIVDDAVDDAVDNASRTNLQTYAAGGALKLTTGSAFTITSGSANVDVTAGCLVNVTNGTSVSSGASLIKYNRYLAAENTSVTLNFTSNSVVAVDGSNNYTSPFTDVTENDWFYGDVLNSVSMGLINGKTSTTYEPNTSLTVAEAVKLAACLHQLYYAGEVTLTSSGSPWYQSYLDYVKENGILSSDYSDYSVNITRAEFVSLFYNAMPSSEYTVINSINDGGIPDVSSAASYAKSVYAFYRAGILTGSNGGHFYPTSSIKRSEVATILNRMMHSSSRKSVTLP